MHKVMILRFQPCELWDSIVSASVWYPSILSEVMVICVPDATLLVWRLLRSVQVVSAVS
jgi:hypothetical protein